MFHLLTYRIRSTTTHEREAHVSRARAQAGHGDDAARAALPPQTLDDDTKV